MSNILNRIRWFRGHQPEPIINKDRKVTPEHNETVDVDVFVNDKTEHMGDDICAICYDKWKYGEICCRTKCKHVYHKECFMKWMAKSHTCPSCRQRAIPPNDPK